MKTNLKQMVEALEAMGIDTSKYSVNIDAINLSIDNDIDDLVGNKYAHNDKIERRWITAQTFRMLNARTYNRNSHKWEYGWDACLRNNYPYHYQFSMLVEEFRVQSKLELEKKYEALKERTAFFDLNVAYQTCRYHLNHNADHSECFRLSQICDAMRRAKTSAEMYGLLKIFYNNMRKMHKYTPKCPEWRDAFKGMGAYESLKNMIKYHDITLPGRNQAQSLQFLQMLLPYYKGEGWRFHALLKSVIKENNFNLAQSIEAHR